MHPDTWQALTAAEKDAYRCTVPVFLDELCAPDLIYLLNPYWTVYPAQEETP